MFLLSGFFANITIGDTINNYKSEENRINNTKNNVVSVSININSYNIHNNEFDDYISVENFGRLLIPGKPNLPSKIFSIAIPPNTEFIKIEYDLGEEVKLNAF